MEAEFPSRGYDRESEQVPTLPVSQEKIVGSVAFAAGAADLRGGQPPRFDSFGDDDWEYERGRQWASIAPLSMPIKIDGKLNPKAVALYRAASDRGYIL